jgi:molybdenum cofactor biosynthesis protein B
MSAVEEHKGYAPKVLGFAAVTVSDSRTPETDTSGAAIRRLAEGAGHRLVEAVIVQDDLRQIRQAIDRLLELPGVDVIVLSGGTGFSPRDVTLQAVRILLEQEVEGFGELFRMLSHRQVGAAAMLSRATAGLARGRAVFVLPGSPRAVELAMSELILPEAGHLLGQARRPTS